MNGSMPSKKKKEKKEEKKNVGVEISQQVRKVRVKSRGLFRPSSIEFEPVVLLGH